MGDIYCDITCINNQPKVLQKFYNILLQNINNLSITDDLEIESNKHQDVDFIADTLDIAVEGRNIKEEYYLLFVEHIHFLTV